MNKLDEAMIRLNNFKAALLAECDISGRISRDAEKFLPGVHFCPDWDEMAIYDESPEKSGCTCKIGDV